MIYISIILIPSYLKVVSIEHPTPTSIIICKVRAMLINPPIEPMRKHEYKPIEVYTCRITLIKSILSRLVFSVFNLPCCCIETPFGSNFYIFISPKDSNQTKIKDYILSIIIIICKFILCLRLKLKKYLVL